MKNKVWMIPAAFFVVAAIANLTGCLICEPMAAAVKPALLPLLALTTVSYLWKDAVSARDLGLLVAAQLLGCTGDILLLHSEVFLLFAGGMVAFLSGHVCYLCLFGKRSWKGLKPWQWAVSVVVMAALVFGLIKVIGVNGSLLAPMAVYACGLILLPFAGLCGTVGDAQIGVHAVQDVTLDLAVLGLGNGVVVTHKKTLTVLGRLRAIAAGGRHQGEGNKKSKDTFHIICV